MALEDGGGWASGMSSAGTSGAPGKLLSYIEAYTDNKINQAVFIGLHTR